MVVCMKWLPKLFRRPGEPQEDAAARGSQVLREQARLPRPRLPDVHSTCLAARVEPGEHEDAPAVELAVSVRVLSRVLPGSQKVVPAIFPPGQTPPASR